MNSHVAFELADLALTLAKNNAKGDLQSKIAIGETLLQIVQTAREAYQQHAGESQDPSPIKREDSI